jgi:hypothetical protein
VFRHLYFDYRAINHQGIRDSQYDRQERYHIEPEQKAAHVEEKPRSAVALPASVARITPIQRKIRLVDNASDDHVDHEGEGGRRYGQQYGAVGALGHPYRVNRRSEEQK